MCFSATASFVAGGTLSAAGALALSDAKDAKKLPLASIPLFFGIQQTIEGVVWVIFGSAVISTLAAYTFLFFAYVFWPVFVPIATLLVETHPLRRKILQAFSALGVAIGLYLLYFLILEPSKAHIVNQSITYDFRHVYDLFYVAP
jgi:4-hydroxybenzoate polyprenyltransferase